MSASQYASYWQTVRRRLDAGEIRSVKMGGLRLILRRDLRAYWEKINGAAAHV